MRNFLKPTTVTWIVFAATIIANISVIILGISNDNLYESLIPIKINSLILFQLLGGFHDLFGTEFVIATPLGVGFWASLVLNFIFSMFAYYIFASLISKIYFKVKV